MMLVTSHSSGLGVLEVDGSCAIIFDLDSDLEWATGLGCPLENGSLGIEVEGGDYYVDGDSLVKTSRYSSCPGDQSYTETARFTSRAII